MTALASAISSNTASEEIKLTVELKKVPLKSIKLSEKFIVLQEAGDKAASKVTLNPVNTTEININWTSSDESVATVVNGEITAIGKGIATITAISENGSFSATTNVIVEPTIEEAFATAQDYFS